MSEIFTQATDDTVKIVKRIINKLLKLKKVEGDCDKYYRIGLASQTIIDRIFNVITFEEAAEYFGVEDTYKAKHSKDYWDYDGAEKKQAKADWDEFYENIYDELAPCISRWLLEGNYEGCPEFILEATDDPYDELVFDMEYSILLVNPFEGKDEIGYILEDINNLVDSIGSEILED